ncbi:uncharacterized protein LOC104426325 [Eucalyptus grandis]|uniref:uncharacterized protein LOC104426325 n=1 Tax=Eucalyptus grandis TaxID=71139 RepID=UPI00192E9A06|nr:uncharacterized protein LOC104426325 [Eucalyptus grandis]
MAAAPPPAPENLTGDETSYGSTVFSDQAEDILRGSFDPVPLDRSRSSALTVCRKADEAAQAGNYRKALRLIEVCFSLPDAQPHLARLHRVRGKINAAIAKAVADPDKNRPYCAVAAESALRAVTLQPCSVEYSYFRGKLLYGMAKEPNDYAEVIAECERGLAIDDPVDSLEDVMDGSTFMSAGSFVERCRRQLRKLIWNSHLATIKDPEGLIGKANEATQTEEERDESARTGMVHLICSSSGSEAKELGERTESEEVVWNFWNSLSDIERKELLRVKISDVVNYFGPTGAPWLRYHLLIALIWTRTQDESWEYFLCPSPSAPRPRVCSYFFDPEPLRQHALQKHAPQFAKSKKPDRIDDEMAELIIKSSWKPLDREATLKALEDQLERKGEDHRVPAGACLLPTRWIVSNDSKRRQSLEKIHCTFLRLITLGCLAVGHLDELLKFALNELHRLQVQNNTLLDCGMKDLPVCLWCLEETQLLEILKFLEHIDSSCREDCCTQKIGSYLDGLKDMLERLEMKDRILLDDDGVYFILHEGLLLDFPNKQGWKDWYERFLEKLQEGLNVMEMLRNECHGLQILCDRRSELLHDKTALAAQMPNHSEISTVDALILQKDAQIERLSHKFTATTAVDYQTLLIPLVISFVRAKLEYCAMKNAIKKSGTAIEVDFMDMRTDGLLTVKVSDFKAYFGSLKVDFFDEFISRSLEYAGTNETWSLSVCCKCPEKIWDSNSHLDNRQNERAGLPQIINHDLAETIINHCWEPLDVLAAPEILNHSPLDDQYPACVNPPPPIQLTEDSQLKELLKKIHHRFAELIRHGYIAESHLNRVSWFVVDELKRTSSASLFQNCSLDLLPSCICFLGAAQLQKVLNYLDEISHHCGLGIVSDKSCTTLEEVSSIYKCMAGEKVIVLSRDASCLLL